MTIEYRYAGPDGARIADWPSSVGAAIGSEYCVHLLPGAEELSRAIAATADRGVPLLLLTPYFRDGELKKAMGLFRAIPKDGDVGVAVNDWGALFSIHALFPRLGLSIGRLLSGQKRCPRVALSSRLTSAGRAWHAEGLFSSPRAVEYLRVRFGVTGYHLDRLDGIPGFDEAVGEAVSRGDAEIYLHEPFPLVTVSDACPWIGGVSSASVASCPRPCREGQVALREPSMGDMLQRGKARFVRAGTVAGLPPPVTGPCRVVRYDDLP